MTLPEAISAARGMSWNQNQPIAVKVLFGEFFPSCVLWPANEETQLVCVIRSYAQMP